MKKIFKIAILITFVLGIVAIFLASIPNTVWYLESSKNELFLNNESFLSKSKLILNWFVFVIGFELILILLYFLFESSNYFKKFIKTYKIIFITLSSLVLIIILIFAPISIVVFSPFVDLSAIKKSEKLSGSYNLVYEANIIQVCLYLFTFMFTTLILPSIVFVGLTFKKSKSKYC